MLQLIIIALLILQCVSEKSFALEPSLFQAELTQLPQLLPNHLSGLQLDSVQFADTRLVLRCPELALPVRKREEYSLLFICWLCFLNRAPCAVITRVH